MPAITSAGDANKRIEEMQKEIDELKQVIIKMVENAKTAAAPSAAAPLKTFTSGSATAAATGTAASAADLSGAPASAAAATAPTPPPQVFPDDPWHKAKVEVMEHSTQVLETSTLARSRQGR